MGGLVDLFAIDRNDSFDPLKVPATNLGDTIPASFREATHTGTFSKEFGEQGKGHERGRIYEELSGGNSLVADAVESIQDAKLKARILETATNMGNLRGAPGTNTDLDAAVDAYIARIKTDAPFLFDSVKTNAEISVAVRDEANAAIDKSEEVHAGASGWASFGGRIIGGFAGGFTDPINLSTMPYGAAMSYGLAKTMLAEAAINVGTEVLAAYPTHKWYKELGREYGLDDFVVKAGISALVGAGFGALGKGFRSVGEARKSLIWKHVAEQLELDGRLNEASVANFEALRTYREHGAPSGVSMDNHLLLADRMETSLRTGEAFEYEDLVPDLNEKYRTRLSDEIQEKHRAALMDDKPVAPEFDPDKPKPPTVGDNAIDPHAPEIGREKQLAEIYKSEVWQKQRTAEFESIAKAEGFNGDKTVLVDGDRPVTLADGSQAKELSYTKIKEDFDAEDRVLSAIKHCLLGGA